MSLILNIDTALEGASVSLARDGTVLRSASSSEQKDHAAWLHPAIGKMMLEEGRTLQDLDAVAVSFGPGSYTGLRVGLAAAKGFCYALDIPLITVGTLEIIASSVQNEAIDLICPLIDARRMEVYAALYTADLTEKIPPFALALDPSAFREWLADHPVLFCGNGIKKLQPLLSHSNAGYSTSSTTPHDLARLSHQYFSDNKLADLAYSEPLYVKEFFSPARKD